MRSCVAAHRTALDAAPAGVAVLVLEDDITPREPWWSVGQPLLDVLFTDDSSWDMVTLGWESASPIPAELGQGRVGLVRYTGVTVGAHAYLIHPRFRDRWQRHLDAILSGREGDSLTGPMAPDGAANTITWVEPDMVRLIAVRSMIGQRRSRSDISPGRFDRVPGVRWAVEAARQAANSVGI
jgi:hypothetical protein